MKLKRLQPGYYVGKDGDLRATVKRFGAHSWEVIVNGRFSHYEFTLREARQYLKERANVER